MDRKLWYEAVTEAGDLLREDISTDIQGYDIDPDMVKAARENAREAGVDHLIHFQARPVSELRHPKRYGFLVTNPPYGERLEEKAALPGLYREIGEAFARLDSWSMYLITGYEDAERYIGRKADRNRKIYNGMLKTPGDRNRKHEKVIKRTDHCGSGCAQHNGCAGFWMEDGKGKPGCVDGVVRICAVRQN